MKLAFVVQRYGLDIAGGAEYHCRIVAEHLARHAQVEVLTTCAADYITWGNHYPEGSETLNGIPVRRFRVKRPRDPERFADWTERVLRAAAAQRAEGHSRHRSERGTLGLPSSDRASSVRAEEDSLSWIARRILGLRRSAPTSSVRAEGDSRPGSARGIFGLRRSDSTSSVRAEGDSRPGSARGIFGLRRSDPTSSVRAEGDSLPRSERGVWGVRRSTPQLNDDLRWLQEEGPFSPRLVEHLEAHRADHDFFIFFSYRYYTTYHGLRAVRDKALLVPTAEDDGIYRIGLFPPFFRLPRAIVYNSVEEREMIRRISGNDSVLGDVVGVGSQLPASLDPERFRGCHGLAGRFVLYVGRIDDNKGCRQLFDYFVRYREQTRSRLRLVLIGKPVLKVPRDPGIVHLGFLPDQEKWDALAACDLLVMPSRLESLSMVTLEAWWAARPVLANAKCEVLRGQCRRSNAGLYYSSYPEFREALAVLEADEALRRTLGRNGRRYFDAHYAWDVVERKYLALLDSVRSEDEALAARGEQRPVERRP